MAFFAVIILGTICIRTLILATIECGCIQLCVLEFVNFLLRGCRCSSICVAKHEFEKVQRFVLVFGQIQVQSSNFSWMGLTKFEVKFWHFWRLNKTWFSVCSKFDLLCLNCGQIFFLHFAETGKPWQKSKENWEKHHLSMLYFNWQPF